MGEQIRIGFGLYLAIFSGIMLPIFLVLMKSKRGFNERKVNGQKRAKTAGAESTKKNQAGATDNVPEMKKEPAPKKDIEPSDHSRFMPK